MTTRESEVAGGPIDPGLQIERTGLAWIRSALALAANAGLVLRGGVTGRDRLLVVAGVVLLALAGAVIALGRHRQAGMDTAIRAGNSPLHLRTIRLATASTATAAAAAVLAILR